MLLDQQEPADFPIIPIVITGPLASAKLFLNIDHQAHSLFRLRVGRGPGAVSYTHLDVYKRQTFPK